MIAVVTGDITNSRKISNADWVNILKDILAKYVAEDRWEIFRGDSFQLETTPENVLLVCFQIRLSLIIHDMDARMAIGMGEQNYRSEKVSESNGSAYIHSGEQFEKLQKSKLTIHTDDNQYNTYWNMAIDLAMLAATRWTKKTAELMLIALSDETLNQKEIAQITERKSQSTISASLKRAGYQEIRNMLYLFSKTKPNI